jgi:hypothetical protein
MGNWELGMGELDFHFLLCAFLMGVLHNRLLEIDFIQQIRQLGQGVSFGLDLKHQIGECQLTRLMITKV